MQGSTLVHRGHHLAVMVTPRTPLSFLTMQSTGVAAVPERCDDHIPPSCLGCQLNCEVGGSACERVGAS